MNFKNMDFERKKLLIMGTLPILAKIILLAFNLDYFGVISVLDIIFSGIFIYVLSLEFLETAECLVYSHILMAVIVITLGVLSVPISLLFGAEKCISKATEMFIAIALINAILALLCFLIGIPLEAGLDSLEDYKEKKEENKVNKIVKEKAGPIIRELKESCLVVDKIEKDLKEVPCLFAGEDREIIKETISLILEMICSHRLPLDTKGFARSAGLSEDYSSYFNKAFKKEGLNPYYVKDLPTFHNMVEYWKNYIKVVKNFEDKSEGVNTRLLKDLYKETEKLYDKIESVEKDKKKAILDSLVEKEIIKLKKTRNVS